MGQILFFLSRHALIRKQVENTAIFDQVHSLGMQSNEMRAIFAAVTALAGFNAEQIGIRAVYAFAQGDTDLGNRYPAGTADREKIFALPVVFAARQRFIILEIAEDPAAHENVRMGSMIGFNLLEAFIGPVNTIPAVNHADSVQDS
jgi:hypothetical protein